jgi:hypothetical protein
MEDTHTRLLRVMGLLQAKEGCRKKLEDAVRFLMDEYETTRDPKALIGIAN